MILLITYRDPKTKMEMVSHGIDIDDTYDRNVVLPQNPVQSFDGVKYSPQFQCWYLEPLNEKSISCNKQK